MKTSRSLLFIGTVTLDARAGIVPIGMQMLVKEEETPG
jgi:hypothetical protein